MGSVWIKRGMLALTLSVSALFMLASCTGKTGEDVPQLLEPVNAGIQTAKAKRGTIKEITTYESSVMPYMEELYFQKEGTLESMNCVIGDDVTRCEVLAKLSESSAEQKMNDLVNTLKQMEEENEALNTDTGIQIKLDKDNGADTREEELKLKQANELYECRHEELKEQLSELNVGIGDDELTAPFNGVVAAVNSGLVNGSSVTDSTPVLALADESRYMLTCTFFSEKTAKQANEIYALINGSEYALEYVPYDASVLSSYAQADRTPLSKLEFASGGEGSAVADKDDVSYPKPDETVQIGDYALICVVTAVKDDVIVIPKNALYTEGRISYVYVCNGETRTKTQVTAGIEGVSEVEITEGISEGDEVYVKQ